MATQVDNQNWFFIRDRKKIGPVPWRQLRDLAIAGQIRPADMLLPAGSTRWTPAHAVAGLFPITATVATVPPLPLPPGATVQARNVDACSITSSSLSKSAPAPWAEACTSLPTIPGYTIISELGRGGMGVVYKAEQTRLKRLVALKMVLGGAIAGSLQLERFRAEAEAIASLHHPNIVQIHEVGELGGLPFFSLEYCGGGSLAQRLDGTPLPSAEVAVLIETLARAVHAAHERNLIHRDLKPANMLLAEDGTPKITDFGLAKKLDETAVLTQSGAVMGTPSYMPPEQALGKNKELGPAADIYALGAILYELLTGRPPFKGATPMDTMVQVAMDEPIPPSRLQPKVAADLETICLKCLEKSASRRYPSAKALADDLQRYRTGVPILARPAGWVERSWKWSRRRPAVAALLGVIVLALSSIFAGVVYFTVQLGREKNAALAEKATAEQERGRAEKERERAEENADAAKQQAEETRKQEKKTDEERKRAEGREAEAQVQLDQARRSLLTAQVWRVAGIWRREPLEALHLLQDRRACPPALHDFAWGYYHTLCLQWKPVVMPSGQGGTRRIAFSPDNKWMATGGQDGTIKLWEMPALKVKAVLRGHKGPIHAVAFSPDGALLASGSEDKTIKLWDPVSENVVATLTGHTGFVLGLAFSSDSKRLVSGSGVAHDPKAVGWDHHWRDGEVRLWDVPDRKLEKVLVPQTDTAMFCIAYAPDGQSIAVGTTHRSDVSVISVTTGKRLAHFEHGAGWVHQVAYSPDSQTVAWAGSQQVIFLDDIHKKRTRILRGHQNFIDAMAWSPDGKTLAAGDNDGRIKLWNPANGQERLTLQEPTCGSISAVAFSPDSQTVVAAHNQSKLSIWKLAPRADWATYPGNTGFGEVVVSPDNSTVACATREKTVVLRDLASGQERILQLGEFLATSLMFSSDGKLLVVGAQACDNLARKAGSEGECQLWNPADSNKRLGTLKGAKRAVKALAFTPDGQTLVVGDVDGKIKLWNMADRKVIATLGSHSGCILRLAVSPDGKTLASSDDKQFAIKLWDLEARQEKTSLTGHLAHVTGLQFLDKGAILVSASWDRSVRYWDLNTGKMRAMLPIQSDAVHSLALSGDGQSLALGSEDRSVKLWDIRTGQLRAVLAGHTREVNGVAFSPDNRYLVSASAANSAWWVKSGEIKVWKAKP